MVNIQLIITWNYYLILPLPHRDSVTNGEWCSLEYHGELIWYSFISMVYINGLYWGSTIIFIELPWSNMVSEYSKHYVPKYHGITTVLFSEWTTKGQSNQWEWYSLEYRGKWIYIIACSILTWDKLVFFCTIYCYNTMFSRHLPWYYFGFWPNIHMKTFSIKECIKNTMVLLSDTLVHIRTV